MITSVLLSIIVLSIVVIFCLGASYVVTPVSSVSVPSLSPKVSPLRGSGAIPGLLGAILTEVTLIPTMITSDCPYIKPVPSLSSPWCYVSIQCLGC